MKAGLGMVIAMAVLLAGGAATVHAEYRAYELEVTDILDCRINKLEKCKRHKMLTAMGPDLYVRTHGGQERIGVILLATWMCRGDTSRFRSVCPRPAARKPKYTVGDRVRVRLEKHITEGWEGRVEVAYYQRSVNGNVYGVRFGRRQDVYARYFEKDLQKSTASAPKKKPAQ
ncbi:MAG: hypothetical protein O7E56_08430 [SAR324 cluster bacterium]|nr:hypothetical protein [SAR324 cluster bacterium]MCZ6558979.1 hypothetical protein [SAR324 cluster bacterium]MCZ6628240.1 hypothetical protein [SAR324 cluster bacterium]MCZ6646072.1 hypothetical protein [SAR324 cluster bacterium]MCZ6730429.1 hypothetical protein [SAR324 cluster bacterium]